MSVLNIFNAKEKKALCEFLIRKLKLHGLEEDIAPFLNEKRKSEIWLLWKSRPKEYVKLCSKCITFNLWTIFITVFSSYLLYFIILLPSPLGIILFEVKYKKISDSFLLNHLCNTLLAIFGINGEDFVSPTNMIGTILAVFGKLIFILIILKICIDKFIENFKSTF